MMGLVLFCPSRLMFWFAMVWSAVTTSRSERPLTQNSKVLVWQVLIPLKANILLKIIFSLPRNNTKLTTLPTLCITEKLDFTSGECWTCLVTLRTGVFIHFKDSCFPVFFLEKILPNRQKADRNRPIVCYHPSTTLREGNVFRSVCHSVHGGIVIVQEGEEVSIQEISVVGGWGGGVFLQSGDGVSVKREGVSVWEGVSIQGVSVSLKGSRGR